MSWRRSAPFFLSHDSHHRANISMSRAVFTSFFPHSLLILYHRQGAIVKGLFDLFALCAARQRMSSLSHQDSARSIAFRSLLRSFLRCLSASSRLSRLAIQGLVKYRLRLSSANSPSSMSALFSFCIALLGSCPCLTLIVIIVCSFSLINQPGHAYYTTCLGVCQALSALGDAGRRWAAEQGCG